MIVFIGLDDTDNLDSRGTGRLARQIAEKLAAQYSILGVTRHQLSKDPRVPCTKKNSSAAIALQFNGRHNLLELFQQVQEMMLADFQVGSDPGLCVAAETVPQTVTDYGFRCQNQLVEQHEACELAAAHGILLAGLGGTNDGIIGALAAVGLAAGGHDGRYVQVGRVRELQGLQTVDAVIEAGVTGIQTLDGTPVEQGFILTDKLRPARRGGRPVAVVDWTGEYWQPVKLD